MKLFWVLCQKRGDSRWIFAIFEANGFRYRILKIVSFAKFFQISISNFSNNVFTESIILNKTSIRVIGTYFNLFLDLELILTKIVSMLPKEFTSGNSLKVFPF